LAERVGCSVTMIGNVETLRKFPSAEMLQHIACSLGAPVCDLFVVWAPLSANLASRPDTGAHQASASRGACADSRSESRTGSTGTVTTDSRVRRLIRTGS
jgi:transcriptional regulator with XRE-family HTH domain